MDASFEVWEVTKSLLLDEKSGADGFEEWST